MEPIKSRTILCPDLIESKGKKEHKNLDSIFAVHFPCLFYLSFLHRSRLSPLLSRLFNILDDCKSY